MNILFIHQNFPGQFRSLAAALVARGHRVMAMVPKKIEERTWQGVTLVPYEVGRSSTPGIHPWLIDLETQLIRGEACMRSALQLQAQGFMPDLIIAHHGWGESLFLKDIWPQSRLALYCEFHYQPHGTDIGFDPEFPATYPDEIFRLRLKNLNNRLHLDVADAGLSPTRWQASTFPQPFRNRIAVIHDGIDTDLLAPAPQAYLTMALADGGTLRLSRSDELITFVNRNLEPCRGYHVFMRALPAILERRPQARVLIVGANGVSYGAQAPGGQSWKDIFIDEVRPRIADADWARVHFLGQLPYQYFVPLLQISRVHVYLTYPFVLSWSLLEAMSCGCAVVASDTAPLHEVIGHDREGRLVDFFDTAALADTVCELLADEPARRRLGAAARQRVREHYDLRTVCLPRQLAWVESLWER